MGFEKFLLIIAGAFIGFFSVVLKRKKLGSLLK